MFKALYYYSILSGHFPQILEHFRTKKNQVLQQKPSIIFGQILAPKIFFRSLRVPFHDIVSSLFWRHEKVRADEGSSFFETVKMSQLT